MNSWRVIWFIIAYVVCSKTASLNVFKCIRMLLNACTTPIDIPLKDAILLHIACIAWEFQMKNTHTHDGFMWHLGFGYRSQIKLLTLASCYHEMKSNAAVQARAIAEPWQQQWQRQQITQATSPLSTIQRFEQKIKWFSKHLLKGFLILMHFEFWAMVSSSNGFQTHGTHLTFPLKCFAVDMYLNSSMIKTWWNSIWNAKSDSTYLQSVHGFE